MAKRKDSNPNPEKKKKKLIREKIDQRENPKIKKGKKSCFYCYKEMWAPNYNEHLKICIYKRDFNLPRADVLEKVFPRPIDVKEIEIKYETIIQHILITAKHVRDTIEPMIERLENKEVLKESPIKKIKQIVVRESTQRAYLSEWRQISQYLKDNDLKLCKENADEYILHLYRTGRHTVSTLKKKKHTLEIIMSRILGSQIILEGVNKLTCYKEKYPMTESDVKNYLAEQINISYEDYIIQRLCISYSLRINSPGLMKLCHLDFLKGGNRIFIPDLKKNKVDVDTIDDEFAGVIKHFIAKREQDLNFKFLPNDPIFSPLHGTEKNRVKQISKRINKRIMDSKVFNFNLPFTFSSHMFRKTQVYNDFHKKFEEFKTEARKKLRHKPDTQAVNHYIGLAN